MRQNEIERKKKSQIRNIYLEYQEKRQEPQWPSVIGDTETSVTEIWELSFHPGGKYPGHIPRPHEAKS